MQSRDELWRQNNSDEMTAMQLFLSDILTSLQRGDKSQYIYERLADVKFRQALEKTNDARTILKYLYVVVELSKRQDIDVKLTDRLLRSTKEHRYRYMMTGITARFHEPLLNLVLAQHTQPAKMYPLLCEQGLFHQFSITSNLGEIGPAYLSLDLAEQYCRKEDILEYIMTFPLEQKREALTNALTEGHPLHDYFNVQRGLFKPTKEAGMFAKIKAALDMLNAEYPRITLTPEMTSYIQSTQKLVSIAPLYVATDVAFSVPNTTQHIAVNAASVMSQQAESWVMPTPPMLPVLLPPTRDQQLFFAQGIMPVVSYSSEASLIAQRNTVMPVSASAPALTNQVAQMEMIAAPVLQPVYIATNDATKVKTASNVSAVNLWQEKQPKSLEKNAGTKGEEQKKRRQAVLA